MDQGTREYGRRDHPRPLAANACHPPHPDRQVIHQMPMPTANYALPSTPASLIRLVQNRLRQQPPETFAFSTNGDLRRISAVLFLLGKNRNGDPFLILNKRSRHVRQPGDLCCPGGGISSSVDFLIARWLRLPATPLSRWPYGAWWRRHRRSDFPKLVLLLAAALREGFEEMRLNPFGVKFLGPMPAQHLVMFKRAIYPLVGWVNRQNRFFPNREVEKIIRIPVAALLDAGNYARYRISFKSDTPGAPDRPYRDMPCFVHHHHGHDELLWGATYRITEQFLKTTFGHTPPPMESLPVIQRRLDRQYMQGSSAQ
jgi:8-oxo-dGTP pyrophosphatase MutT (NUDIX family)